MSSSLNEKRIEIKTPGKLFLSGEWSVLEQGNPSIVIAVNKYVSVKIESSKNISNIHLRISNYQLFNK